MKTVTNVSSLRNSSKGSVAYSILKDGIYTHRLNEFDGTDTIIGVSRNSWLECEMYRTTYLNNLTKEIVQNAVENKFFNFYFSSNHTTPSEILKSFLLRNYSPKRIENFFIDDETINYVLKVDINDLDLVSFLFHYGKSSFSIYDISIDNYLPYAPNENREEFYYRSREQLNFHEEVLNSAIISSQFNDSFELMQELGKLRARSEDIQTRVLFELFHRLEPGSTEYKPGQYGVVRKSSEIADLLWVKNRLLLDKQKYNSEKDYLLEKGSLNIRWKSEYAMFEMVKNIYNDAKYQYHDVWLGKQSLDIYIPSIKLGIEYQGIQHYEAVDLFGGEEGLKTRIMLDEKKRKLCQENGVNLLEWKYDKPVTAKSLKDAIKLMCIKEKNSNQ